MPYDNNGTGFNKGSYTSWLAAQKQSGKRETQQLKIIGLFVNGYGVRRQGCLGITAWHVKNAFEEMFCQGKTSSWTARLASMASPKERIKDEFRLAQLVDADDKTKKEAWKDPEGVLRVLYFRESEIDRVLVETHETQLKFFSNDNEPDPRDFQAPADTRSAVPGRDAPVPMEGSGDSDLDDFCPEF